ncbi:MAG: L,D-transpeptidase [Alphaproteobacteria bacterium]|nr:L,D-transpeptidase [Alphaproteobacteria bacterium]
MAGSITARLARRGASLALLAGWTALAQAAPAAPPGDFGAKATETLRIAARVVETGDAQGLPFVIVDKVGARVFAFDGGGRLRGAVPALLGAAHGDDSPAGIGTMRLADIRPDQRITPAGRFEAHLGPDLGPRDVLWIDYAAAISLHRVVTAKASERREQRLATRSTLDNRISYGCINVPVRFYEDVVQPLFKPASGIVYILPETRPIEQVFAWAAEPRR